MKKQNGITLIALVITIIVLLILAAIALNTIMGDDGILNNAETANLRTEQENIFDALNLKVFDYSFLKIENVDFDVIEQLKTDGYINENMEVVISKVLGTNSKTGNGSNKSDVYMLERKNTEYHLTYYDSNSAAQDLGQVTDLSFTLKESDESLFSITNYGEINLKNRLDYYNAGVAWDYDTIVIPKMVNGTEVEAIGSEMFPYIYESGYSGQTNFTKLKTIIIQEGVTTIYWRAFYGCFNVEKIQLPSTLTYIDSRAFENCTSIKNITIPENVTRMGNSVFNGWTEEQTINVPFKEGELPSRWNASWAANCNAVIKYKDN